MTFPTNITALATAIATEFRNIRTLISGSPTGDISGLTTTDKASVVAAINEVKAVADGALAGGQTAAQVQTAIDAAVAALVDSSPGTLDTLNELAAALGDDPNFAATITASLALKADAVDVYTKAEIGDPTTDYVAAFNAALNA